MKKSIAEMVDDHTFTYNQKEYDCSILVKRDKENILRQADCSHKGVIDSLYIRESLQPVRCAVYADENDNIVYFMIIYEIKYKNLTASRSACGDYYPFSELRGNKLFTHPFQGQICW